jgi:hypothetical protein
MKNKIIKWRKEKLDFVKKNSEVRRVVCRYIRLKISFSPSYDTERGEGNMKDRNKKGEFNERLGHFRMRYHLSDPHPHTHSHIPLWLSTHLSFICNGQQSSDIEHTLNKFSKLQPCVKFTI